MAMLEDKVRVKFAMAHPVVSWAYVHAAWLINRFANHSPLRCTPFEIMNGRRYSGRLVNFGEYVLVLQKTMQYKHGPRWFPGVWLGKTTEGNNDLRIVATPPRRNMGMAGKGVSLQAQALGFPVVGKPVEDKEKVVDQDAEDVLEYALKHGDGSDEEAQQPEQPNKKYSSLWRPKKQQTLNNREYLNKFLVETKSPKHLVTQVIWKMT